MNGYFLAEAAASRHAELLRTARDRRRAREARQTEGAAGSSGRTRRVGSLHPVHAVTGGVRAFVNRGWIAPPTAMVEGKAPGDGRGAVSANLAFGPAGTATCAGFRVAAGHGAV